MANAQAYYDQLSAGDCTPMKLQPQVTCPHCWERFAPENILWVTEHIDLLGDPLLGAERQQRFLPSRYTLQGDALDAKGMACRGTACPKCHLPIPRSAMETELLFISILGGPGSGKSYFLTSMIWQLRQLLPAHFRLTFTDADPESNRVLNEYEESLFLNHVESEVVPLADLILKTDLQGALYDSVSFGQQTISYPRPFLFMLQPQEGHPGGDAARLARLLCLYDNAGEHFQPGQDTAASAVTRHLAQSRAILFLFDPTQDPRFRAVCRGGESAGMTQRAARLSRQETILNEAAMRIRRHTGMSQGSKYEHPLVVVVSKFDEWSHLLGDDEEGEPWRVQGNLTGVDVDRIERRSARLREVMLKYSPETVSTAESLAKDVTYVAVSALGGVERDPITGAPGIKPMNLRPYWVTVPLLYSMSRVFPALIPRLVRRARPK
jgi:hypothetical protein